VAAALAGKPPRAFDYPLRIQLASIGHQTGVAYLMGLKLYGFLAWWLWRGYYLWRLPRLEKQVRVMLEWTLDLVFPRDIVQLKLVQTRP
jgi:NADH dehydrogenase